MDPFLVELVRHGPWALMSGFLLLWIRELQKTLIDLVNENTAAMVELKDAVDGGRQNDLEFQQELRGFMAERRDGRRGLP